MLKNGFTFLEVLVSIFVLTIALLGYCKLLQSSLQQVKSAQLRLVAMQQAKNFIEINAIKGAKRKLTAEWQKTVNQSLPRGAGHLTAGNKLFISWEEPRYGKQTLHFILKGNESSDSLREAR